MLVAIDHGNYSIKTPHFSFVSGLTEHTVRPPMADEVLEYDGKYWALTGQRLPYMREMMVYAENPLGRGKSSMQN